MSRIISKVDTESTAYRKNFADMSERVKTLRQRLNQARYERPQSDIDSLKKRKNRKKSNSEQPAAEEPAAAPAEAARGVRGAGLAVPGLERTHWVAGNLPGN